MFGHVPARNLAGWLLILLAAFGNPARTAADTNRRIMPTAIAITSDDAQIQDRLQTKVAIIIPTKPSTPLSASPEPFGIDAVPVTSGQLATTWTHIEIAIGAERKILARCRMRPDFCSSAAQSFLAIIAEGHARTGRARLGLINRAINLAISPRNGLAQEGVPGQWNLPLETFSTGRGDCKNYAIAKYVALLEAGIAENDVNLVILRNLAVDEDHAVVVARLDGGWIVLDNRSFALVEDVEMHRVVPLFVLDHNGIRQYAPSGLPLMPRGII
jgi:predicted transglutaminase-like cysteine proteinase